MDSGQGSKQIAPLSDIFEVSLAILTLCRRTFFGRNTVDRKGVPRNLSAPPKVPFASFVPRHRPHLHPRPLDCAQESVSPPPCWSTVSVDWRCSSQVLL